ncbi:Lar family restriction alleviation protein [Paracoccus sp. (in: a-proteobacteria)]|uniref:Lar family restriction alleviation protein n=1 Tax=Paracoccus sp. TaxID=267 RepID=UPI0028AF9C8F|nr:Lar family restriction alleviation protein [Paracoccus sp. (in: a-proteobacteria)]
MSTPTVADLVAVNLLPCPFCGENAKIISGGPGNFFVQCQRCAASTDDGSQERAVECWNRRALSPAATEPVLSEAQRVLFTPAELEVIDSTQPTPPSPVTVEAARQPDFCYDPEYWDCTYTWEDACELEDGLQYGLRKGDDQVARVCTLFSGPDKWVARIPLDTTGDGEADDWEVRWFDSREAARAALSGDEGGGE